MKLLNEVHLLILLLNFITNSSPQKPPLTFDSSLKNLSNGTNGQDKTASSKHSQTNSIIVMIPSTIRNSEAFVRSQKSLLNQLATLNLDRTVNSPHFLIQYTPNSVQNQRATEFKNSLRDPLQVLSKPKVLKRPSPGPTLAKPKFMSKQSMVNRGVSSIGQEPFPTTSSSSKTIDNSLKVMKSFSSVDIMPNDTIVSVDIVTTAQSVAVSIPTSTPKPPVEATKTPLTRIQKTGEIPEPGDAVVPPWAAALDLDPPENNMPNPYSMTSNFWYERNYPQYSASNFHYEQYPYHIKPYSAPRYRTNYRKRPPMIKGFSRDDVLRRLKPERIKQYEASNDFGVIGKADALPVQKYPNVPTRPFPKYQDIYVRHNSVPGAFQRVYIGEQRPHETQPQQSRSTIDSINSQNTYKYPSFPPPPPPSFPLVSALDYSPLLEQPDVLYLSSHYEPPMYVPYQEPILNSMPYIYNPQHAIGYGQPSLILDSTYGLDTTSNALVLTDEKVFQKAKSAIQSSLAIGVDKNTNSSPAKNTIFKLSNRVLIERQRRK